MNSDHFLRRRVRRRKYFARRECVFARHRRTKARGSERIPLRRQSPQDFVDELKEAVNDGFFFLLPNAKNVLQLLWLYV